MKIRKYWMVYLAAVLFLIVAAMQHVASGSPHYVPPVKYGQQFTFYFNVFSSSDPNRFYATAPASADVHIIKNGGAAANPTNSITDLGKTFSLVLTATEMTAAVIIVEVNDLTPAAAYMDESWLIPTYGDASALSAFNLDDAEPNVNVLTVLEETPMDDVAIGLAIDNGSADVNTLVTNLATLQTTAYGIDANSVLILADTNSLQIDWANGGRLDLILDAAAVSAPTVDEIWDELLSGHTTVGSAAVMIKQAASKR